MKITDDVDKMKIIERLVKDGAIDFTEALKLLQEPEQIVWQWPLIYPQYPVYYEYKPFEITCNSGNAYSDFGNQFETN